MKGCYGGQNTDTPPIAKNHLQVPNAGNTCALANLGHETRH
jgi:hypothetical protein